MIYVKVVNGEAKHYNPHNLKKHHPNTSIPKNLTEEFLATYDIYPLVETERPIVEDNTKQVKEASPIFEDGVWKQVWIIQDAEPL